MVFNSSRVEEARELAELMIPAMMGEAKLVPALVNQLGGTVQVAGVQLPQFAVVLQFAPVQKLQS